MGDMAEYYLDQGILEELQDPDSNVIVRSDRRSSKKLKCQKCGKANLRWKKHTSGKWWLIEKDGAWHKCEEKKVKHKQSEAVILHLEITNCMECPYNYYSEYTDIGPSFGCDWYCAKMEDSAKHARNIEHSIRKGFPLRKKGKS